MTDKADFHKKQTSKCTGEGLGGGRFRKKYTVTGGGEQKGRRGGMQMPTK